MKLPKMFYSIEYILFLQVATSLVFD